MHGNSNIKFKVSITYHNDVVRIKDNRTQFTLSINVWRLAGDTLNITCNVLYCNHQVHRDSLITLYIG